MTQRYDVVRTDPERTFAHHGGVEDDRSVTLHISTKAEGHRRRHWNVRVNFLIGQDGQLEASAHVAPDELDELFATHFPEQ